MATVEGLASVAGTADSGCERRLLFDGWSRRLDFRAVARDVNVDAEETDGLLALIDGLRTQQALVNYSTQRPVIGRLPRHAMQSSN